MSTLTKDQTDFCCDCGMPCGNGEYHPYAACLMFKGCHDSKAVRANLDGVVAHGYQMCSEEGYKGTIDPLPIARTSKTVVVDAQGWLEANGPGGWIDNLRKENEKLRVALGFIMAESIPQGMSPSLFAEAVLAQTGPDDTAEKTSV